ncbi:MAG: hypothetical protein M5U34_36210 [Chloroflexi bacterium]|nr:hypothetical protein [Chloroflexota bacterium]
MSPMGINGRSDRAAGTSELTGDLFPSPMRLLTCRLPTNTTNRKSEIHNPQSKSPLVGAGAAGISFCHANSFWLPPVSPYCISLMGLCVQIRARRRGETVIRFPLPSHRAVLPLPERVSFFKFCDCQFYF